MAQLRDVEPELARRGVPLWLLGSGQARHVEPLRAKTSLEAPIYLDSDLDSFRAAGLRRGVLESFHPKALPRAIASLFRGHGMPWLQGDAWQQGGALVIEARTPEKPRVLLHHISRHVADLVDNQSLLAALDQNSRS